MEDRTLLGVGVGGALVAAICCFTPALVLLLGAVGLSALVGWWLDLVLLPALAFFVGLALYALVRRARRTRRRSEAGAREEAHGG